ARSWHLLITICESAEKGDHIINLARRKGRRVTGRVAEGWFHIDIATIGRRQIVEFLHAARRVARGPLSWIAVTIGIEFDRFAETVSSAVVKESRPQRDIAQRRCAEAAAIFAATGEVEAQRTAGPEIEEICVSIGRNCLVAGDANCNETVIGELRWRPVFSAR